MKFSPARMILILLLVLGGTGVLLLSQESPVVGEGGGNVVRMPVDTRVIELEDPAEAPKLVEEKKDQAAETAAPEPGSEPAAKPQPAPAPKPEAAKQAQRPAPWVPSGNITKLDVQAAADGVISVQATADAPLGRVRCLWLKGPDRFVVDLLGKWRLRTRNVVRHKQGMIKHMVAGEHKDRLRLVIHFRTPPGKRKKPVVRVEGTTATVRVYPNQ